MRKEQGRWEEDEREEGREGKTSMCKWTGGRETEKKERSSRKQVT